MNEGVPEWPPAPWRLLRTLVAAHHAGGVVEAPQLETLLRKLSSPPSFSLPPATAAHTRHYLSLNKVERTETSLTFDTFVVVDRAAELITLWDVDLLAEERTLLERLIAQVSYLGRAESWCDLRLVAPDVVPNCGVANGEVSQGTEAVRLLGATEEVRLEDLEYTTGQLQKEGWNAPPGSRWLVYRRPRGALRPVPTRASLRGAVSRPTLSEFALGAKDGVLPLYVDALRVSDKFRSAALSRHGSRSAILAGKDEEGRPLSAGHSHAHYLPDSRDSRGRVTHVLVWAPAGLGVMEQQALAAIDHLGLQDGHTSYWAGREPLEVVLCGFGEPVDVRYSRLFGRSRRWRSRTPFVLPRHPKRGREGPEEQLLRELSVRGMPAPRLLRLTNGARLGAAGKAGLTRWVSFEVRRRKARPTTPIVGFEIEFDQELQGPLLLGWGCHYGLGAFEIAD